MLLDKVAKECRLEGQGWQILRQVSPTQIHQSNGAAEKAVSTVRGLATTFLAVIKDKIQSFAVTTHSPMLPWTIRAVTTRVLSTRVQCRNQLFLLAVSLSRGAGVIFVQTLEHCSFLTRPRRNVATHSCTRKRVFFFVKGMMVTPLSTAGVSDEVAQATGSSGRCLKPSKSAKKLDEKNYDVLSIPGYVIVKGSDHGARHGPTERQRMYHKAFDTFSFQCVDFQRLSQCFRGRSDTHHGFSRDTMCEGTHERLRTKRFVDRNKEKRFFHWENKSSLAVLSAQQLES